MSLWGKKDGTILTGKVSTVLNNTTMTGANTAFVEEVDRGDMVRIGANSYVVTGITDDETATITPKAKANATTQDGAIAQAPKYLDPIVASSEVSLVTTAEAKDNNNRLLGIKTPGWTVYKTYGAGRKKVETLVALKS